MCEVFALLEKVGGRPDKSPLLANVNAGSRAAEPIRGAGADFHDHEYVPVNADYVELADSAKVIALENLEPLSH